MLPGKIVRGCPRCGSVIPTDVKFCAECGAPVKNASVEVDADLEKPSAPPSAARSRNRGGGFEKRLLVVFLGILALAASAIVILLVEDYRQSADRPSVTALVGVAETSFRTPSPSPSPTPTPLPEFQFYGAWLASRIETNKNKVKPNIDVKLDTPYIVLIDMDGYYATCALIGEEYVEVEETVYSLEGDSIYLNQGMVDIEQTTYQGRVRYFFSKDELRCVYLLNGREVSDYIIFTYYSDIEPAEEPHEFSEGELL